MLLKHKAFLLRICFLLVGLLAAGQQAVVADSVTISKSPYQFILPAALITYGAVSIENPTLKSWDADIRKDFKNQKGETTIDDYLYFIPGISVYALEIAGVEPLNNVVDRIIVLVGSLAIMHGTVKAIKNEAQVRRPDGRSLTSLPSGHTASAFVIAEFAHQELGHLSPWYSIGSYSIAAFTGYLKVYNDKHWFSDIVAGAGVGILLTKLVYWGYPKLKNLIFKPENELTSFDLKLAPVLIENKTGLGFSLSF